LDGYFCTKEFGIMNAIRDIETLDDIKLLVDTFYTRVQGDELIGGIFLGAIKDWPLHLDKMYRFWQTVLLEQHTYSGAPFAPHARLPIGKPHFERWLSLFKQTVEEYFSGPKASEALWRAGKMAEMFQHKLAYFQAQDGRQSLI
jgi:hemoglobin